MNTASGRVVVHALRGDHGQNLGQALADTKAIAAGRDALTADKAAMQAQTAALREEIDAKSAQIANLEIQRAAGAALCDALHLPFNPDFVESMSTITLSGDRERKSAQLRLRPRRTVCVDLASEIKQSAHHTSLAQRLGYPTDPEPAA